MNILEFIFQGPGHFFGTLILLMIVLEAVVNALRAIFRIHAPCKCSCCKETQIPIAKAED